MRPWGAVGGRGLALAFVALLVAAASALAAAHFAPGALYTGRACQRTDVKGSTCVFKFQASTNGESLHFTGETVITTWGCHGGGGEALLGGQLQYADPIPVVRLGPSGALHGSAGSGQRKVSVSGHLTNGGAGALITFHLVTARCATEQVTLTKH